MISFFRKLRQKFLKENKVTRYLIYALGEILLVVIGILIALWVNNLNEERKLRELEVKMLQDLVTDIKANIKNLEFGIQYESENLANSLHLMEAYENQLPLNDSITNSLGSFLGYWDPDFTEAAFQNLKSQGVNLISNSDLRKSIIDLFDVDMDILDQTEVSIMRLLYEHMSIPLYKKYLFRSPKNSTNYQNSNLEYELWSSKPQNYKAMMKDPEFYAICSEFAYRHNRAVTRYQSFNEKSKLLIEEIERQISSLKN